MPGTKPHQPLIAIELIDLRELITANILNKIITKYI